MPKADAVFEGGGVRGIAHAGALLKAEEKFGYEWQSVAGTSAGAIVAALVAAGYRASEIRDIIWDLDFAKLMDKSLGDRISQILLAPARLIPRIGRVIPYLPSIVKDLGIYEGDFFQKLVAELLAVKGKRVFGDLLVPGMEDDPKYRYRLRVIASDITAGRMLVLPDDIRDFGIEPDDLPIALALRMSMSIPFFFEPVKLANRVTALTHYIVDGGMLSNYPIWLFDAPDGQPIDWPTLGFNIYQPRPDTDGPPDPFFGSPRKIDNPLEFVQALEATSFSAIDKQYVSERHWARTIAIDSMGIKSTDFDLTDEDKQALLKSGQSAADAFLTKFDFEAYKREWRASTTPV